MTSAERPEHAPHDLGNAPSNAGIHLVEHQRIYLCHSAGNGLNGETQPRQFAARGDFGQWTRRRTRIGCNQEINLFHAMRSPFRARSQRNLESPPRHRQVLHLRADLLGEFTRGTLALLRQTSGNRTIGLLGHCLALRQLLRAGTATEFFQPALEPRESLRNAIRGDTVFARC